MFFQCARTIARLESLDDFLASSFDVDDEDEVGGGGVIGERRQLGVRALSL